MKKFLSLLSASSIATLITTGAALAQTYPANVLGTWSIRANDTQVFTFTVSGESSDAPCAYINGVMGAPNDPIEGYYCPATGQVSFLRNSVSGGGTYQVYTGQLSWAGNSDIETQMTGSFTNYGGTNTGAFAFAAALPSN
jgi:hypothetical protein